MATTPAASAPENAPEEPQDPLYAEYAPAFSMGRFGMQANPMTIAVMFVRDYPLLYDQEVHAFTTHNPATGVWEPVEEATLKVPLFKFTKRLAKAYQAEDFLPKCGNGWLNSVLALAKGFPLGEDQARRQWLLVVANGMLDISGSTPRLLPFDPAYHARRRCAVAYRPEAECPRFLNELLKMALQDDDDVDLFRRYLGAVLFGENHAQRILFLHGEAARGKSTVVSIIERLIGLENVAQLRTGHLPGRFETHGFQRKTLLTAKDVAGDFLYGHGAKLLKALVGDDLLESEMKYGGKFHLRGNFNIIVTSNTRLHLALEEDDAAWGRRLLILRVAGPPPKQRIANFAEVLLHEEAEGILAWAIEGAIKHRAELEETGDFRLTAGQQARIEDLLQESKSPAAFVKGRVCKEKGADLTVDEIKAAYLAFCQGRGWRPFGERSFENALRDLMQACHGVLRRNDVIRAEKAARGFRHVALKTLEEEGAQ